MSHQTFTFLAFILFENVPFLCLGGSTCIIYKTIHANHSLRNSSMDILYESSFFLRSNNPKWEHIQPMSSSTNFWRFFCVVYLDLFKISIPNFFFWIYPNYRLPSRDLDLRTYDPAKRTFTFLYISYKHI